MGTVFLLALSLGLAVYGGLLTLPRFSPRAGLIRRFGPRPITSQSADSRLGRRLRQVPLTRRLSPERFRLIQLGLAAGGLLLTAAPALLFGKPVNPAGLLLYPPLLWAAPQLWLALQVRRRRTLLARAYPDLLAHLVTQTRADAGTLQAFASSPAVLREPLRGEVEELIADMRIAPIPAALQRFAERCDIPEIRDFVHNLIYQQEVGIALPEVLAAEDAHALAMARQEARRRIQQSAVVMAAVTVILLLNGLLLWFTPVFFDLSRFLGEL